MESHHETKSNIHFSVAGIFPMKTYYSKKIIASTLYCSSIGFITMQYPNFALCFGYRRIGSCNYKHQPRASGNRITSTFAKLWLSTSPLQKQEKEDCESKDKETRAEGEQTSRKKKKRILHRREFVGLAKAVDRGQFETVYQPMGKNGTFMALSGLPNRTKLFTVLGIESSCDDTGGMYCLPWAEGITYLIILMFLIFFLTKNLFHFSYHLSLCIQLL
jgi:hypothetical protein